jgi:hypothetical protein
MSPSRVSTSTDCDWWIPTRAAQLLSVSRKVCHRAPNKLYYMIFILFFLGKQRPCTVRHRTAKEIRGDGGVSSRDRTADRYLRHAFDSILGVVVVAVFFPRRWADGVEDPTGSDGHSRLDEAGHSIARVESFAGFTGMILLRVPSLIEYLNGLEATTVVDRDSVTESVQLPGC